MSNINYVKLNPINTDLDKSLQYKRILDFSDLFQRDMVLLSVLEYLFYYQ